MAVVPLVFLLHVLLCFVAVYGAAAGLAHVFFRRGLASGSGGGGGVERKHLLE